MKKRVYVGRYGLRPHGVEELPSDKRRLLSPTRNDLPDIFWTNNPIFLRDIKANEIFVYDDHWYNDYQAGWIRLDKLPEWHRYQRPKGSLITPAEFVSCLPLDKCDVNPIVGG